MRWLCVFSLALTLSINGTSNLLATEFSKSEEFGPIVVSYSDVGHLISNLQSQIAVANRNIIAINGENMSLTVGFGKDRISINDWSSLNKLSTLSMQSTELNFQYTTLDAPIQRVQISLNDFRREITVAGLDQGQVLAVYGFLKDQLSVHIRPWQGPLVRLALGIIFFFIGGQFVILPFTIYDTLRLAYTPFKIRTIQLIGVVIVASIFTINWSTLLPGFSVYLSTDNLGNLLGIFGLAAALIIPACSWLRPNLNRHGNPLPKVNHKNTQDNLD